MSIERPRRMEPIRRDDNPTSVAAGTWNNSQVAPEPKSGGNGHAGQEGVAADGDVKNTQQGRVIKWVQGKEDPRGQFSAFQRLFMSYDDETNTLHNPGSGRIHHNSEFRKMWDISTCLILGYMCITFPLQLAFDFGGVGYTVMSEVMNIFFILDLFLNFVTTFEDDNRRLVTDFGAIAHAYVCSWFLVDLVSSVPVEHIPGAEAEGMFFKAVKMLKLVKLMRVLRLSRLVGKAQEAFGVKNGTIMIIKFAGLLIVSAHWLGCLFYFFTAMDEGTDTWLMSYLAGTEGGPIKYRSSGEIYVAVLYWALTTMSTIGYGDIIPISTAERIITSVAMIIGSCTFAYGLTNVCFLVYNYDRYQVTYEATMDENAEFFSRHRVPNSLYSKIQKYFWFKHYASRVEDNEDVVKSLEAGLPISLHRQLKTCISRSVLQFERAEGDGSLDQPVLFYTARNQQCAQTGQASGPSDLEYEIAKLMRGAVYTPEDEVVNGTSGKVCPAVSILTKGTLEVTMHRKDGEGIVKKAVCVGSTFGEASVVLNRPMIGHDFIQAIPEQFVEVHHLEQQPLAELLARYHGSLGLLVKIFEGGAYTPDLLEPRDLMALNTYARDTLLAQPEPELEEVGRHSTSRLMRSKRITEIHTLIHESQAKLGTLTAELTRLRALEKELLIYGGEAADRYLNSDNLEAS